MTAFLSIFLWFRCAVILQILRFVTVSALWEVSIAVILQSLQELTLPVSGSAGQLGQTRGADLNWRVVLEGLSLGEFRTAAPASATGLVTEIGLVKADSRLEERDPDLCSNLLAFHALGLEGGGAGLGTKFL